MKIKIEEQSTGFCLVKCIDPVMSVSTFVGTSVEDATINLLLYMLRKNTTKFSNSMKIEYI